MNSENLSSVRSWLRARAAELNYKKLHFQDYSGIWCAEVQTADMLPFLLQSVCMFIHNFPNPAITQLFIRNRDSLCTYYDYT